MRQPAAGARSATPYTVADYLVDRLVELGVGHVFGVPGDFTLGLLDRVVAHPGLEWVGCANELNAGYAADGYARMRGIAALATTFGVGELSAINATAGSFAEHVPVVQIVGAPPTGTRTAAQIVHHSLGDGSFDHFMAMHTKITCARSSLTAASPTMGIDRVLTAVRDHSLPGNLLVPTDVAALPVDRPERRLPDPVDLTDSAVLEAFTTAATALVRAVADGGPDAGVMLGGLMVHRTGCMDDFRSMLTKTGLRHAISLWAKSLVDETDPRYLGSYAGAVSEETVRHPVEQAELLIIAGVQFTDLDSGFFTHQISRERTIELSAEQASVGPRLFGPISLRQALAALTTIITEEIAVPTAPLAREPTPEPSGWNETDQFAELDHVSLWGSVSAHLRPGDIVLADQGTSFYGMAAHRLPPDVMFIGQPLWASIGYTLPALLGACLAAPGRRGILLIGDGAAQMTLQELATIMRFGLDVVILVIDNDGYTIERAIHGPDEIYNDAAAVDWAALPGVLGPGHKFSGARVATVGALCDALDAATPLPDGVNLIQAVLDRDALPPLLRQLIEQIVQADNGRTGQAGHASPADRINVAG